MLGVQRRDGHLEASHERLHRFQGGSAVLGPLAEGKVPQDAGRVVLRFIRSLDQELAQMGKPS